MINLHIKNVNHTADKLKEKFIMSPTVDFCFKELMSNEKVRKGLISAFLNVKPEDILETVLLNTNLRKEFQEEKLGILDVRVLMYDKSQIDLEMQVQETENELLQWGKFLNGKREENFKAKAEKNEYIGEAYDILNRMSADREKRLEYEAREKAIRDHNHLLNMAKKEGVQEGIILMLDNLEDQKIDRQMLNKLMDQISLSLEEKEKFLNKYVNI